MSGIDNKSVNVGVSSESNEHTHNFTVNVDDETGAVEKTFTGAGGIDGHTHEITKEGITGEANEHTHTIAFVNDGDKSSEDPENETKQFDFNIDTKNIREEKSDEGDFGFFSGLASTFGNKDLHDDIIKKGAFTKTLKSKRIVKILWQHRFTEVIGSAIDLKETDKGLEMEGRINLGTQQGREAFALLKAGDLDSMSIGFITKAAEFNEKTGVRTITEIKLFEVSIVTEPANPKAVVTSIKSIQELDSLSGVEDTLKAKGFTSKEAKTLVSKIKSLQTQRDVEEEKANEEAQRDADAELVKIFDEIKLLIKTYKGD